MDDWKHITVTREGDVFAVRLKHIRLEEYEIQELGVELIALIQKEGCRKLAMILGPETPYCLYSVFLSILIAVRNCLRKAGGRMVLCEVGSNTYSTFEACKLQNEFLFLRDLKTAITFFGQN